MEVNAQHSELTCCKIKEKDSKRAAFDVVFIARRLNFTCLCDKDDALHNKEGGHVQDDTYAPSVVTIIVVCCDDYRCLTNVEKSKDRCVVMR